MVGAAARRQSNALKWHSNLRSWRQPALKQRTPGDRVEGSWTADGTQPPPAQAQQRERQLTRQVWRVLWHWETLSPEQLKLAQELPHSETQLYPGCTRPCPVMRPGDVSAGLIFRGVMGLNCFALNCWALNCAERSVALAAWPIAGTPASATASRTRIVGRDLAAAARTAFFIAFIIRG